MIYVPRTPEEHMFFAMWLKSRIPHFEPRGVQTVVCYQGEKIGCVVGFSNPHYNRIEMSWASDSPKWVTRGNILSLMAPAFMPPARYKGITAVVMRKNRRVRKFIEGIGFEHEGTMRGAGPNGENLMVYGLLKKEYMELVKRFRPKIADMAMELMNG